MMVNSLVPHGDWLADPFFDQVGRHMLGDVLPSKTMKTDIKETEKEYRVSVDVPGTKKENVKLHYSDDLLDVSVRQSNFEDHTDNKGNLLMSERTAGQMSRQYRLPYVDKDKISASLKDGVLTIVLPKLAEGHVLEGDIPID